MIPQQYERTVDEGPKRLATECRFAALVTVNRQNVFKGGDGPSGNMASGICCFQGVSHLTVNFNLASYM